MELNVSIDQKAVEQQVVQAVLDSAIGKRIEEAIGDALKKPERYGGETLIVNAVRGVVMDIINNTVAASLRENDEFKKRVKELVEELTTDDVLRTIITKIYTQDC